MKGELTRPDYRALLEKLQTIARDHAPELLEPLVGREAIMEWLTRHGFVHRSRPVTWRTVLDWQRRCGEPLLFHAPAIGVMRGKPVTTPVLMLAWAMTQAAKLGPPTSVHFVPGSRAMRKRRARLQQP